MSRLKDSSEIREAVALFEDLVAQAAVLPPTDFVPPKVTGPQPDAPEASPGKVPSESVKPKPPPPRPAVPPMTPPEDGAFRGDRLEHVLVAMCERGGFTGAVIADLDGLPLAVYNSPVGGDAMAAFTTVLGDALAKAAKLLEQHEANNISLDINYTDKVVLRQFASGGAVAYLMIICPQDVDERAEVELSIDQISSILQ